MNSLFCGSDERLQVPKPVNVSEDEEKNDS